MTESQKIRITQIANIVAEQNNVSLPEGARPTGLDRLAYVLEHGAGITPEGGRTALGRLFDCFKSGKVSVSDSLESPAPVVEDVGQGGDSDQDLDEDLDEEEVSE